ncbi:MAG TPA: hypothetical protein ENN99_16355 [Chloroflexi bacterium]|nr:hypothetical protein [Chloroflexota bacterium]
MDDSIALTERLMHLLAQELTGASDVSVGYALRQAKSRYLSGVPSGSFGTYDEKSLIEAALYGLPMYRVSVPTPYRTAAAPIVQAPTQELVEPITLDLSDAFQLETGSVYGDYYAIEGQVQANPGRPVQPRISQPVPDKSALDLTPHGVVLVSAVAESEEFNPLISMPVTDTTLSEPPFASLSWSPTNLWAINRLGPEPTLVVVPAQFRGNQDTGILRRFTTLQFEVYYTTTASLDFSPPIIWQVQALVSDSGADFQVTAQDTSGIQRVLMVYTQDGQSWLSRDLTYNPFREHWEAHLTELTGCLVYFIQVVDGAGNVTTTTNKGLLFALTRDIYLPLIMRGT